MFIYTNQSIEKEFFPIHIPERACVKDSTLKSRIQSRSDRSYRQTRQNKQDTARGIARPVRER